MRPVHIKAILFYLFYSILMKVVLFLGSIQSSFLQIILLVNIVLASIFGMVFLYLFTNKDFFKFAGEIEKKNTKKEKTLENKFRRFGKTVTVFLIGVLSGPLIGALAAHFLLPKNKNRYFLIAVVSAISAVFWLTIVKTSFQFLPY